MQKAKKFVKNITKDKNRKKLHAAGFVFIFAVIGIIYLISTYAALLFASIEPENGQIEGCASIIHDTQATGGKAIQFSSDCKSNQKGANLPINYNLGSLGSNVKYVSTTGSDTATGSINTPYKTLAKAIASSSNNGTVVIRGGTYREGNLNVNKSLKLIAYPGEVPVFTGAQDFNGGWITEGSLSYRAYNPQPVTDGSGISFTAGQNQTADQIGKHPDQFWIAGKQLKQISQKSQLNNDSFWVDGPNKRLYTSAGNANKADIEASDKNIFAIISSPNTTIDGLHITRYSDSAKDAAAILLRSTAHNSTIKNTRVSETAFTSIKFGDDARVLNNVTIDSSTIERSNWMGVVALYTDNFTINNSLIQDMNYANEFTFSPQSGALKTSRTRYTKVTNSDILNNNSQGLWFDQSNLDVDIANNNIIGNNGSGLFFEISDDLLLVNNYIKSSGTAQPVKLAGSSGLKVINNTIVGGANPLGIYTDFRSIPGCSDPAKPLCSNSYSSDRDTLRPLPNTMDWMPRLDLMVNNVIGYPTAPLWCGSATPVCITSSNSGATAPINTIIHKADPSRDIPQTIIDSNVYANGTANIIVTSVGSYKTPSAFSSAMNTSPIGISGIEVNGKYGNNLFDQDGKLSASLISQEGQAYAIPNNQNINQYIPAGTKKYGRINF